jgi:hypothetical protein
VLSHSLGGLEREILVVALKGSAGFIVCCIPAFMPSDVAQVFGSLQDKHCLVWYSQEDVHVHKVEWRLAAAFPGRDSY